ncbi:hypothetical protein BKA81DRAFT_151706 [Phyllosticta paracitricarpa]
MAPRAFSLVEPAFLQLAKCHSEQSLPRLLSTSTTNQSNPTKAPHQPNPTQTPSSLKKRATDLRACVLLDQSAEWHRTTPCLTQYLPSANRTASISKRILNLQANQCTNRTENPGTTVLLFRY